MLPTLLIYLLNKSQLEIYPVHCLSFSGFLVIPHHLPLYLLLFKFLLLFHNSVKYIITLQQGICKKKTLLIVCFNYNFINYFDVSYIFLSTRFANNVVELKWSCFKLNLYLVHTFCTCIVETLQQKILNSVRAKRYCVYNRKKRKE